MMISPEAYYEENLRGKTSEEIMRCIRSLKNEMGHLKKMIEKPPLDSIEVESPGPDVRLYCARLYLYRAIEALKEAGGEYKPSNAELKAGAFNDDIPLISKIVFTDSDYNAGKEIIIVTLGLEKLNVYIVDRRHYHDDSSTFDYWENLSKDEFLDGLKELYIGEWCKTYGAKKLESDNDSLHTWSLEIHYSDWRKVVVYRGVDAYPYNFDKLKELFGMDY